jgi:hypothetical protein
MFLNVFLCLFSCVVCLLSSLCILCFCIALCIVSHFVYSCPFPIFAQLYRSGGNPIAVNKYHIISYIISYIIPYHSISYTKYSYNVILSHLRVITVTIKKQYAVNIMGVCLYSFTSYPECESNPYLRPIVLPSVACLAVPNFFHTIS